MLIKDTVFGIIDLETTGLLAETDRVVEAAIVWCEPRGIYANHTLLYDPGIPIPPAASAIHHITDDDVEGLPKFSSEIFFGDEENSDVDFYAAHNAEFDGAFLKPVPKPLVCTMRLAQKLYPEFESHSNQFLRYRLGLKPPIDRHAACHRALPDALVTATLLIHELNEVLTSVDIDVRESVPNNTVEELVAWIERPMILHRIRFGKHGPKDGKPGMLWSEVPKDYLRWMVGNMADADRDTMFTARHYLGIGK
jgi:exodeoxyribonuclease X